MLRPRLLRVLQINDEVTSNDPGGWFEPMESGTGSINDFESSQRFWANLNNYQHPPDLILVDINFEKDQSSPLKGEYTKKPTGLLYAIPFLAWCRTSHKPTAVAFHTGDPGLFDVGPVSSAMRALAIELASLAASIDEGGYSTLLDIDDVIDWRGLCSKLYEQGAGQKDSSRTIWALLPDYVRKIVTQALADRIDEISKNKVVKSLNSLLKSRDFCHSIAINSVNYVDEAIYRLNRMGANLPEHEVERLNRQILESIFPIELRGSFQITNAKTTNRAFHWILDRTKANSESALKAAAERFRKKLIQSTDTEAVESNPDLIIVDPVAHATLLTYCIKASEREAGIAVEPQTENWPGLTLVFKDGSRDCISVQSIFADVPVLLPEYFKTPGTEGQFTPWRLFGGKPLIGHYLERLASWTKVYDLAIDRVKHLPHTADPLEGGNLNTIIPGTVEASNLVRFLILMFQIVRLHHTAWENWRKDYTEIEWNPKTTEFQGSESSSTLKKLLQNLYQEIKAKVDADKKDSASIDEMDVFDIFDKEYRLDFMNMPSWIRFHMELLRSLGLVGLKDDSTGNEWFLIDPKRQFPDSVPPCPQELQPEWLTFNSKSDEGGALKCLIKTLGFEHHIQIERIVASALGTAGEKGEFFRVLYETGRIPGWIRALCQIYAEDQLHWLEIAHWPRFMQQTTAMPLSQT